MPEGPTPFNRLVVDIERPEPALAPTVRVRGDVDLATAPALQRRLELLVGEGVESLVVDLRRVAFCDVAGLNVLLRARAQLSSRGGELTVLGPCPPLQMMVAALGLGDRLHLRTEGDGSV